MKSVFATLGLVLGLVLPGSMGQDNVLQVHGSGTTNPSKCYWSIMDSLMDRAKLQTRLTYRAVGSSTGQKEFIGGIDLVPDNDFGAGDIPISTENYNELQANGISIMQLPVLLGATSLFHSVPNVPQGIGGLNLTSCMIARIFRRDITDWLHEDIVAVNPNLKSLVGAESFDIRVAHRRLGSSSTAGVTQYLRDGCPNEWPEELVGNLIEWALDTDTCEGSGGMTACIRDTPGTIGYLDAGHGHSEGLVEIELLNADGRFLSSLTAARNGGIGAAAENAALPNTVGGDFGGVELLNEAGEYTWPIVSMSYVYVRQSLTHIAPESQGLLLAFLNALYDPDYIYVCSELFGFTPVPAGVRSLALDGLNTLELDASASTFTFETSTQANAGQDDYVISSKRRSYAEYERSSNTDGIGTSMTQNAQLSSLLAATEAKLTLTQEAVVAAENDIAAIKASLEALTSGCDSCPCCETQTPSANASSVGDFCFPGGSLVQVLDKGPLRMEELKIGDDVHVGGGKFSKVYSFGHYSHQIVTEYLQLFGYDLHIPLEITKDHMVFTKERGSVPAGTVQVGDNIVLINGTTIVTQISTVRRTGAYAPFTHSGTIAVNNVVASCYVSLQEGTEYLMAGEIKLVSMQWLAHALHAPHRMMCTLAGSANFCANKETYTDNGISNWVHRPLRAAQWLFLQSPTAIFIISIPVILIAGVCLVTEFILMNTVISVLTVVTLASFANSTRRWGNKQPA